MANDHLDIIPESKYHASTHKAYADGFTAGYKLGRSWAESQESDADDAITPR